MSSDPAPRGDEDSGRALPPWARLTLALAGGITALATALIGFYQINSQNKQADLQRLKEDHEFQLAQQAAAKNVEKEIAQMQLTLETEQTKEKEAEKEREQAEAEKANSERATADLQKALKEEELQSAREESNFKREQQSSDRLQTLIDQLLDPYKPKADVLALLANETGSNGKYRRVILAALIAKAETVTTISEARLLLDRMEEIGAESIDPLIDIHRNALEEIQVETEQALADAPHPGNNIDQKEICDKFVKIEVIQAAEDLQYMGDVCRKDLPIRWGEAFPLPPEVLTLRTAPSGKLNARLYLVHRSAAVLTKVLENYKRSGVIDVGGLLFRGTRWVGKYPTLNFALADVSDTDFSQATFDRPTIASIPLAKPLLGVFRGKIPTDPSGVTTMEIIHQVRFSPEQLRILHDVKFSDEQLLSILHYSDLNP